ncbi:MAG: hypothetical protein R2817_05695 [Flavobacteriales bacterium]
MEYKKGITAKLRYLEQGANGPVPKAKKVKVGDDLYKIGKERGLPARLRGGRDACRARQRIRFSNGITLSGARRHGGMRDDIQRAQMAPR